MDLGLKEKVAVVVGGSKGIGWAIAEGLLEEGSQVAVLSRSLGYAEEAGPKWKEKLLPIQADVTDENQVKDAFGQIKQRYGKIDVLVHNAGQGSPSMLDTAEEKAWKDNIELNLLSVIRSLRYAVPLMEHEGGNIILIGAASAKQPTFGQLISNVTKGSLLQLTKSLAEELAPKNISINNICPGRIISAQWERKAQKQGITVEQFMDTVSKTIPMGRFGSSKEVADLAVFLASERSRYITGQSINVDGGWVKSII